MTSFSPPSRPDSSVHIPPHQVPSGSSAPAQAGSAAKTPAETDTATQTLSVLDPPFSGGLGSPYLTSVPGYPRVGAGRVYKKLLEGFWSGSIAADQFVSGVEDLRIERLREQARSGLDLIPCGDFSLYDHVLDTAIMLGCIPARFQKWVGQGDTDLYFAMARGRDGVPACEMTKWFDTNYHYLVPELPERFTLTSNPIAEAYRLGRRVVGHAAKPVMLGPFTFLKLARLSGAALAERLLELTPIYATLLRDLTQEGAALIQIDEPALVGDVSEAEWAAFAKCYEALGAEKAPLLIQTYYGDVGPYFPQLCALPVAGLGLDFVRGHDGNLAALRAHGFPAAMCLSAGVVDGRNVWRTDLDSAYDLVQEIATIVEPERLQIGASCSLLHLPETAESETHLPSELRGGLCFARERLTEISLLASALRGGKQSVAGAWAAADAARCSWLGFEARHRTNVSKRVADLAAQDFERLPYSQRVLLQRERQALPLLPTTTIGSFPQTAELRYARAHAAKDPAQYRATIEAEIERVIRLQEQIGLDVLVHGEPERNDMVQFFAERLTGFCATREGWVQSYGSRCVRPPLLYGDVERYSPMTLDEARYAQSLTEKPVKGMLTGPITILQWSFVREDIPREEVAYQIGLAIRDEAHDLEAKAALSIIQVDEAAFREGLPLRRSQWAHYLRWAVRAFRLVAAGVSPSTQVHTHMCYSEFGDIIEAIAAMDADVISIEDARSDGAMLETLRDFRYRQQIGPGLYDIHSQNVPSIDSMALKLEETLERLPVDQVWVNPDCGLKTRDYAEVIPALTNMVAATRRVRERLRG